MKLIFKVILILWVMFCLTSFSVSAVQAVAGDITYRTINAPTRTFEITVNIYYRFAPGDSTIVIHYGDGYVDTTSITNDSTVANLCSEPVAKHVVQVVHSYVSAGNYVISAEVFNRIDSIVNIPNSANVSLYLQMTLQINPFTGSNDSPVCTYVPLDNASQNIVFIHNPVAVDPDGDSLSYEIIPCYAAPGYFFPPASNSFSMNAVTGDLVWDTPLTPGYYSVGILIKEWRNGNNIGAAYRDMMIVFCPVVGIGENIFSSGVRIFPNPSDGNIQLTLPETMDELQCEIIDVLGARVLETNLVASRGQSFLNLSALSKGVYLIRIRSKKEIRSGKLIIE
ncbi:MAG TPA: T9SS type A sorting domain-containing protein [Bacteroidia bacterium]|nr:T9SS type A sorting domain-containing protein [Bacteroidia bacterium]